MPLPKFKSIGACMSSETMQQEFPDQKQRVAMCYRQTEGVTPRRERIRKAHSAMKLKHSANRDGR